MKINRKLTTISILILIFVILFIISAITVSKLYVHEAFTCSGKVICYGKINEKITDQVWLDYEKSVLEQIDYPEKICNGIEEIVVGYDHACSSKWERKNKILISCDDILDNQCVKKPDEPPEGISCKNWFKYCQEIKSKEKVVVGFEEGWEEYYKSVI